MMNLWQENESSPSFRDASGDGTDALQYSGSFGVKSEPVKGYAKVAADGKSCTFLETPTV